MKRIALGLVVAGFAFVAVPAQAQQFGPVYYWEDDVTNPARPAFGWSISPQPSRIRNDPPVRGRNESLVAFCNRITGRALRFEQGGQNYSVILTEGCVRQLGR